jgi:hypothetical protein
MLYSFLRVCSQQQDVLDFRVLFNTGTVIYE